MLIAVLSDIHANLPALQRAIEDIQEQIPLDYEGRTIEQIWCLGDLIGRGPQPVECIERFQQLESQFEVKYIAGNHEAMYFGTEPVEQANPVARAAIQIHQQLSRDYLVWLRDRFTDTVGAEQDPRHSHYFYTNGASTERHLLRFRAEQAAPDLRLYLCHGSWFDTDPFGYLWPQGWWEATRPPNEEANRRDIQAHMRELAAVREATDLPSVLLCGHTHVPAAYYADAGTADAITAFALPPNERIHLENRLYLFNVGSVGHSRVGPSTETRYPVLDTVASTIEMRVMSYPAGELVQALRRTYSFSLFIKLKEYFENPPPDPRYLI